MNTKETHTHTTTEEKSTLGSCMTNCCTGRNRCFGSVIRILLALILLLAAFGLGAKFGANHRGPMGYGMGNGNYHGGMMNRGENIRGDMRMNRPLGETGTQINTPAGTGVIIR